MSLRLPSIRRTINDDSYNNLYKHVPCIDEDHRNSLSSDKDYSKYYNSLEHTSCSFIFLKGKNKGEICGKKTTDDLGLRCSQHKFT
jgi:hypothetical protein